MGFFGSSFFSDLAVNVSTQLIGDALAPKHSTPPPAPVTDTGALTQQNLAEIQSGKSQAQLQSEQRMQSNANSLLAGVVPKDVQDMVTQRAAETASVVGLSPTQSRNLQLRDLGLSSLDALKAGAGLQNQIDRQHQVEQTNAYNQAVDTANQTYDAYAIQEQARLRAENLRIQRHANTMNSLTGLMENAFQGYQQKKQTDALVASLKAKQHGFEYVSLDMSSENIMKSLLGGTTSSVTLPGGK